ncbi:uncharacterized protein A4U43_C03F16040 [Asparagus officinalis]|uniref:Uncharacterized protein n=1 Tax=Asparagus officinalis TaxID=4686 RepID=A0A5P1FB08_ASPOF|nr:uncharacterized protein A4U43_C03F16040 [Asparagus officinalis]
MGMPKPSNLLEFSSKDPSNNKSVSDTEGEEVVEEALLEEDEEELELRGICGTCDGLELLLVLLQHRLLRLVLHHLFVFSVGD